VRVRIDLKTLRRKKFLITAGPTREYWDPVRYLSNGSSGRMGMALAQVAANRGAKVTLIVGPTLEPLPFRQKNLRVIPVVSAREMRQQVCAYAVGADVVIGAAAVADYRPAVTCGRKIKEKPSTVYLKLIRNPDIIAEVARRGPRRPPLVVGFALETEDVVSHAMRKLKTKNLDWIVANQNTNLGAAKGSVTLISRFNNRIPIGRTTKERLAKRIWTALLTSPLA
jgi:phosphopantothenoylcysteine decarboxylase / phosphopantothenate---cysteine ligase